MTVERIFLESKPAPFMGSGYGHYYLVKRQAEPILDTNGSIIGFEPVSAEDDQVIRGGPNTILTRLETDTGKLIDSDDAYRKDNGEITFDFDLATNRVTRDITAELLSANSGLSLPLIWSVMTAVANGIDQASYDYEIPDFYDNHFSNSNSVAFTVLNAVNFDVRTIESELELLTSEGISLYDHGFAGGTDISTNADPTIDGQGTLPDITASSVLKSGVAMLGRGNVDDMFTGTKYSDRYYGYQEFELPFLTTDTVTYARLVGDMDLGNVGLTVELAPKTLVGLFKTDVIEITGVNESAGPNGGINGGVNADYLHSIERVELTANPDTFNIGLESLDAEITIDMGDSRRTQSEIDAFNATLLPEQTPLQLEPNAHDAFIQNVDVANYSSVDTGLNFYYGETSEREQGILHSGSTIHNIGAPWLREVALATGVASDRHNLVVENADKVILTNKDDVFIGADRGTIVDLGAGADKVWLRPDIMVKGFDDDDRLTLYGVLNLYGGYRNSESELPWAEGFYGIRYAINPAGDLVVNNPWLKTADGNQIYYQLKQDFNSILDLKTVSANDNTLFKHENGVAS